MKKEVRIPVKKTFKKPLNKEVRTPAKKEFKEPLKKKLITLAKQKTKKPMNKKVKEIASILQASNTNVKTEFSIITRSKRMIEGFEENANKKLRIR